MINNGFTKKKVGTLTLGEKLRKLREEKRISLLEVSRSTKIKATYLESLEAGQYKKLPADVYIRGFLRSYADFLGVDGEIIIRLYDKEREINKNLEKSKAPREENSRKTVNISPFIFTPKKIGIFLALSLVLAGLGYVYRELGSFASEPRLVVLSPQNNAKIDGSSVFVEGVTDKDAVIFINEQPVLVDDEGKFRGNLTLQFGVNSINIKAINRFKREAADTLTVVANFQEDNPDNSSLGENEATNQEQPENEDLSIEIRVDPGPVWLNVESDGNLAFSGTMLSGSVQTFRAKEKIVINSGRANATLIKFNGKDIGALGNDATAVRGVTFTKDTKY